MKTTPRSKNKKVDKFINNLKGPPLRHLLFGNERYLEEVRRIQIKTSNELREIARKYPGKPGNSTRIGHIIVDESYQHISRKQMITEALRCRYREFVHNGGFFLVAKKSLVVGLSTAVIIILINQIKLALGGG